jgi:hypothetical protein
MLGLQFTKYTVFYILGGTIIFTYLKFLTNIIYLIKSPNLHLVCGFSNPTLLNHLLKKQIGKSTDLNLSIKKSINFSQFSLCNTSLIRNLILLSVFIYYNVYICLNFSLVFVFHFYVN